ncbi:MAG: RES family NAD+ phosphorylase [Gemmatimonadaceae bacterium]
MANSATPLRLWRIFPWDANAKADALFSPESTPPKQGSGRFDLGGRPPVLYLAESPAHAIGEKLQRYRGQQIDWPELREFGHPLAVVQVTVNAAATAPVADLCDPVTLLRYQCRPDELMSRDSARTQAISRHLYVSGLGGFRVWSALTGDWHSTVVFLDRLQANQHLSFADPVAVELDSAPLHEAAELLALTVVGR